MADRCRRGGPVNSSYCRRAIRRISSGPSPSPSVGWTGQSSSSIITTCALSSTSPAFPLALRCPTGLPRTLEKRTHRTADHVIATNESYRTIAIARSGKSAADVTVVRSGPDPERLRRGEAHPELRRGHRYLAAYIGVMGPQDGVDIVLRAADIVLRKLHREDIAFTLMGSGDCFSDLVALRDELGLGGHVADRPGARSRRGTDPVHS